MLLNEGVNPVSNTTIIPKQAFKDITTASAIANGAPQAEHLSINGYGMGWRRQSYKGYDVSAKN